MEIIAYRKVGLSPYFVDELVSHFALYSCTVTSLFCHFRNIDVESNDGSHLESLDAVGPGGRISKKKKKKKINKIKENVLSLVAWKLLHIERLAYLLILLMSCVSFCTATVVK